VLRPTKVTTLFDTFDTFDTSIFRHSDTEEQFGHTIKGRQFNFSPARNFEALISRRNDLVGDICAAAVVLAVLTLALFDGIDHLIAKAIVVI
jgi:hypothetical protein